MINKKQETIADIVAEMRKDIAEGTVGIWSDFGGEIARSYADRIEEAHQREVAELRSVPCGRGNEERRSEMRETRSALAELAERITEVLAYYQDDMYLEHRQTLDMAQRIVAELAKVKDKREWETNSDALWRCNDCIATCRVIAEEGTGK